jgi:hypothetical protein
MAGLRSITRLYKRIRTLVLLIVLISIIIIKGRNFNIERIYRRSVDFIERTVKDRKLRH